jgi:hypothetical protein
MNNLDRIRDLAKKDATRQGRPLAILNLNRFNPLYVIREVPHSDCSEFVELIMPDVPCAP